MSNDFLGRLRPCVIRCGFFGMPAFNNDEIVIPEFIVGDRTAGRLRLRGDCIETAVGGKWGYRRTGMKALLIPARVMAGGAGRRSRRHQRQGISAAGKAGRLRRQL